MGILGMFKGLEDEATRVRKDLDGLFKFIYADDEVNAYVGDVCTKRCMEEFIAAAKLTGIPELEVRREIGYLSGSNSGVAIYIGDVSDTDYAVFVRGVSEATPIILGEEITHGEHKTEHVRRLGSVAGFHNQFGDVSIEFLGYLGLYHISKGVASASNSVVLDVSRADGANRIGYDYASRLIRSGKEISYPDLFHAKNNKEIWDIVNDIIGP